MAKYKLEYIWLDGYTPVPSLRSKTQIKEFASLPKLADLPVWGFDGSSTQQAEGKSSDIILKPVACYPDSTRKNGVLVSDLFPNVGEIIDEFCLIRSMYTDVPNHPPSQWMMNSGVSRPGRPWWAGG